MKTLKDVMPKDFMSWSETRAYKFRDVEIKKEYMYDTGKWVGKEKFVFFWVELVNGYAVGWNENPARGWSFPVVKMK